MSIVLILFFQICLTAWLLTSTYSFWNVICSRFVSRGNFEIKYFINELQERLCCCINYFFKNLWCNSVYSNWFTWIFKFNDCAYCIGICWVQRCGVSYSLNILCFGILFANISKITIRSINYFFFCCCCYIVHACIVNGFNLTRICTGSHLAIVCQFFYASFFNNLFKKTFLCWK